VEAKPCGLLNVQGYFDQLLGFLDHAVAQGFLREQHRRQLKLHDDPAALLRQLLA
jgi:predicted Rossmann-fold nucleotide-binding protein